MTYELINSDTTNSLAAFSSIEEAQAALETFRVSDAQFAGSLALVAFDDDGLAIDAQAAAPALPVEVVSVFGRSRGPVNS